MDVDLHRLGSAMLQTKVEQQHAAAVLETVPLRGQHSRQTRARVRERLPEPLPADTGAEEAAAANTFDGAELRDEL